MAAICDLFIDYMAEAEPEMKKAVSFTASMIVTYNIGRCAKLSYGSAYRVMTSHVYRKYLKSALTRKCSIKHKAFFPCIADFSSKMANESCVFVMRGDGKFKE